MALTIVSADDTIAAWVKSTGVSDLWFGFVENLTIDTASGEGNQDMDKGNKVGRKAADISGTGFAAALAAGIRKHRAKQRLSVEELATKAGISRVSWYRFEAGTASKEMCEMIDAIASALGVSPESLAKPPKNEVKENHASPIATNGRKSKGPTGGRGIPLGHGPKSGAAGKAGIRGPRAGKDFAGGTRPSGN